eukprot:gene36331-47284_t
MDAQDKEIIVGEAAASSPIKIKIKTKKIKTAEEGAASTTSTRGASDHHHDYFHQEATTPATTNNSIGIHDTVLMSPNSGAALDAVLQQEELRDQQMHIYEQESSYDDVQPQQYSVTDPPVVSAGCDGAAAILTTGGREHVEGRTDDTIIVSTPPSVVQEQLLMLGNGTFPIYDPTNSTVDISKIVNTMTTLETSIKEFVLWCYPELQEGYSFTAPHLQDTISIYNKAILCALNDEVDEVNKIAVELMNGEQIQFFSADELDRNSDDYHDLPIEYLNSISMG